jgi:hypothetical protein
MSATKYNFNIEQGSSFRLSLVYKDSSGNAMDLTNWCARLVWYTDTKNTQTFTTTNLDYTIYKFTIDPIFGKLTLLMPPETTNALNFDTAKYDLELQSDYSLYNGSGNDVIRLLYGTINVLKRFSKTEDVLDCNP